MNENNLDSPTESSASEPATGNDAAYRVLARKYRPQEFSELVGQDALITTITNAIREGRIAHAFILTGVRGVGKTTTARIIARSLNCIGADGQGGPTVTPCGVCEHCRAIADSRHVDVLEMDAASRTGVDNMRELLDSVRYLPASARFKIYIIDEVHMLSIAAFNALLKTLEEPPAHVKFIFATTEIRKLPVTVLSRCQRFDLRRIGAELLVAHFSAIAEAESVRVEAEAMNLIAGAAEGSARDGLSLLDQAIAHCVGGAGGGEVTAAQVRGMLGLADRVRIYDLFEALMRGNVAAALSELREQYDLGADPEVVLRDLLELTHLLTRLQVAPSAGADPGLSEVERSRAEALAAGLSMPVLARTWQMLLKGLGEVRSAPSALAAAEMILIRLAYSTDLPTPLDAVRQVTGGGVAGRGVKGGDTSAAPAAKQSSAPTEMATTPPASASPTATRQGGGAVAAALPEPYVAPDPEPAASIAAKGILIDSFAAIVEQARTRREARLYHHLMEDVSLVEFRPGHLEINPGGNAPLDLANTLRGKLESWTQRNWAVVINSQSQGFAPLAAKKRRAGADIQTEAENDPLVRAVMDTFPGAKVTGVRPLGGSDGAHGSGVGDGGPDEDGPTYNPNIDTDEVEQ
ncbi:MAG: DNA polymerase III subunit gamma/tau [Alphaproteobacteria bacterium]